MLREGFTARARRIQYARQAIANPLKDWQTEHPEIELIWVERAIVEPDHQMADRGRVVYFSRIPESDRWLRVVLENDRLLTAYLDRRIPRRLGVL